MRKGCGKVLQCPLSGPPHVTAPHAGDGRTPCGVGRPRSTAAHQTLHTAFRICRPMPDVEGFPMHPSTTPESAGQVVRFLFCKVATYFWNCLWAQISTFALLGGFRREVVQLTSPPRRGTKMVRKMTPALSPSIRQHLKRQPFTCLSGNCLIRPDEVN